MSEVDGKTTGPAKAKQSAAGLEVTVSVVIETPAFKADTPELIDQAEGIFRERVAEAYGNLDLTNVRLIKVNHHIGTDATYVYAATLKS